MGTPAVCTKKPFLGVPGKGAITYRMILGASQTLETLTALRGDVVEALALEALGGALVVAFGPVVDEEELDALPGYLFEGLPVFCDSLHDVTGCVDPMAELALGLGDALEGELLDGVAVLDVDAWVDLENDLEEAWAFLEWAEGATEGVTGPCSGELAVCGFVVSRDDERAVPDASQLDVAMVGREQTLELLGDAFWWPSGGLGVDCDADGRETVRCRGLRLALARRMACSGDRSGGGRVRQPGFEGICQSRKLAVALEARHGVVGVLLSAGRGLLGTAKALQLTCGALRRRASVGSLLLTHSHRHSSV